MSRTKASIARSSYAPEPYDRRKNLWIPLSRTPLLDFLKLAAPADIAAVRGIRSNTGNLPFVYLAVAYCERLAVGLSCRCPSLLGTSGYGKARQRTAMSAPRDPDLKAAIPATATRRISHRNPGIAAMCAVCRIPSAIVAWSETFGFPASFGVTIGTNHPLAPPISGCSWQSGQRQLDRHELAGHRFCCRTRWP